MTTTAEKTMQRILVVDDESSISELISTSLRFVGFDVRTAANGTQALAMAEEFRPHAMVLDVMLPDVDGIYVTVADNGPGLSEDDQKKIFQRFFHADPSRQRNSSEGSDLGLSIVDAVMQAHGGKVGVVSKPGEGATFTLFFPSTPTV